MLTAKQAIGQSINLGLSAMATSINIILLEDHPLFREGLKQQIKSIFPFAHYVYEGADVFQARKAASSDKVHLAIVDLHLGDGRSPAEIVSTLSAKKIPVLVLSALATFDSVQNAITVGAKGFISKDSPIEEIMRAIKAVSEGNEWIAKAFEDQLPSVKFSKEDLSPQERKALLLYASGLKLNAVARRMNVAPSTVKQYLERAKTKYRLSGKPIRTKTEMYKTLRNEGLLE